MAQQTVFESTDSRGPIGVDARTDPDRELRHAPGSDLRIDPLVVRLVCPAFL